MKATFALAALSASFVPLFAQPAPLLQIFRETVKEGRSAAHEKVEMDYVRSSRKANHPGHYLAIESISGPQEVWFVSPMTSFAKAQEFRELNFKEPLKGELEVLDTRDGEIRSSSRAMWAVLRPEMSYGVDKMKPGTSRYVSIGTYRVRLGREGDLQTGSKELIAAFEKANLDTVMLCYQVVAGAPMGTYLFISPMLSLKTLDEMPGRQRALMQSMGAERYGQFMKSAGDIFLSMETTLFAMNPRMSYLPKEVEDAAPDFWRPKAAKPAATKPKASN